MSGARTTSPTYRMAVKMGPAGRAIRPNPFSAQNDGDWYLRSAPIDGEEDPLLQPGVPIYEAYAGVLQSFNQLGSHQASA